MQTIQASFTSGELSPELSSRVDLQKYASGLKTARNVLIGKAGGVFNRPGSRYVGQTKTAGARLFGFEVASGSSYAIEVGVGYFRFFKDHAAITSGASVYEVSNTYTADEIYELRFIQSNDIVYITHENHVPKTLTRIADDDWDFEDFPFINGPFRISNSDLTSTIKPSATTGNITLVASEDIFDADHIGSIWRIKHRIQAQAYNVTRTATVTGTSLYFKGTWYLITTGTWTGTLIVEKSYDNSTWTEVASYSSADNFNIDTFGAEADLVYMRVRLSAITSGSVTINFRVSQYTNTGIVKITSVTDANNAAATVISVVGSETATSDWAEGSWSDYRGYPSSVLFYQDRLVFAGLEDIWMSKTSNYVDFGISDPLVDSDSIGISLPSRKLNQIRDITGLKQLIALTFSTAWSVRGLNGIITPTTVQTDLEEYRGVSGLSPLMIGNKIIFNETIGATFRELGYNYEGDSYVSSDISILSEHLFAGYTMIDTAYQQEPYSVMYAVRDDGKMLAMTYMPEQEVLAWSWFETDGEYKSVITIPSETCNEVWTIVDRDGVEYIEYMRERTDSEDPADHYFVDCGFSYDVPIEIDNITKGTSTKITISGHSFSDDDVIELREIEGLVDGDDTLNGLKYIVDNAGTNDFDILDLDGVAIDTSGYSDYDSGGVASSVVTSISGLDWLTGKEVSILADGNVLPRQTVISGMITLDPGYSRVHVGLPYISDIATLKPELNLKDGTVQGKKLKISDVKLRVLRSRGGFIGPDEDNLIEFIQREVGGDVIDLVSGQIDGTANFHYSDDGSMLIRQVDPLPMHILALIPEITIGG